MKTVYRALLCWTLLLAGCSQPLNEATLPDSRSATLSFGTNDVRIGDITHATLTVRHPATSTLELPDLSQDKRILVRDVRRETETYGRDELLSRIHYDLTSWEVGAHVLSSNDIVLARADGPSEYIPFPDDTLTIISALDETDAAFRGLKPLATWKQSWPWLAILLILTLLLILMGARILRRRKHGHVDIESAPPPTPPHVLALEALRELMEKQYIEKGKADPYYVELSDIVRHYVEDRFHLHAPEQTTEEFIRDVSRAHRLSHDHRILLEGFLEQCDLVKFARHRPREGDMRAAFNAASRLVEETKQAVHPPREEAA